MGKHVVAHTNVFNILDSVRSDDLLSCQEASYNRLDASSPRGLVELEGAVHAAVVGEGDRAHAAGLRRLDKPLHLGLAVEQAVFGMDVEVSEVDGHGDILLADAGAGAGYSAW